MRLLASLVQQLHERAQDAPRLGEVTLSLPASLVSALAMIVDAGGDSELQRVLGPQLAASDDGLMHSRDGHKAKARQKIRPMPPLKMGSPQKLLKTGSPQKLRPLPPETPPLESGPKDGRLYFSG